MSALTDLVLADAIVPRLAAPTRKLAIQALAETLADAARLDRRCVFDSVLMRERLSGTGVGEGVAIPHALVEGLERPVGGFARLDPAADFKAIDGRAADLVFMLLAPKGRGGDHLKALARISRFFRRADIRERLRAARTQIELAAVFSAPVASGVA
ncbi:MAG TPA: PTS sugar transporter subunit IIA [Caulobacterales bacterium]|jgi:PTS system nitrogen regulatory IIA component|nr:PTS sugar transporter subunit IIA [Caulobacterales bacterium]